MCLTIFPLSPSLSLQANRKTYTRQRVFVPDNDFLLYQPAVLSFINASLFYFLYGFSLPGWFFAVGKLAKMCLFCESVPECARGCGEDYLEAIKGHLEALH